MFGASREDLIAMIDLTITRIDDSRYEQGMRARDIANKQHACETFRTKGEVDGLTARIHVLLRSQDISGTTILH